MSFRYASYCNFSCDKLGYHRGVDPINFKHVHNPLLRELMMFWQNNHRSRSLVMTAIAVGMYEAVDKDSESSSYDNDDDDAELSDVDSHPSPVVQSRVMQKVLSDKVVSPRVKNMQCLQYVQQCIPVDPMATGDPALDDHEEIARAEAAERGFENEDRPVRSVVESDDDIGRSAPRVLFKNSLQAAALKRKRSQCRSFEEALSAKRPRHAQDIRPPGSQGDKYNSIIKLFQQVEDSRSRGDKYRNLNELLHRLADDVPRGCKKERLNELMHQLANEGPHHRTRDRALEALFKQLKMNMKSLMGDNEAQLKALEVRTNAVNLLHAEFKMLPWETYNGIMEMFFWGEGFEKEFVEMGEKERRWSVRGWGEDRDLDVTALHAEMKRRGETDSDEEGSEKGDE